MKWARKKSSLYTSLIRPLSWLSKFKQRRGNSEANSGRNRQNSSGFYFPTPSKSLPGGFYYNMDEDDAYWRISFSKDRAIQARRSTGGINLNPLWHDEPDQCEFLRVSGAPGEGRCQNFDDMVLGVRRMKERQREQKVLEGSNQRQKDGSLRELRSHVSRGREQGGLEHKILDSAERDIFPARESEDVQKLGLSCSRRNQVNAQDFSSVKGGCVRECPSKLKEIKIKPDQLPKPHCRKMRQNTNRPKVYSPRTECKIRALEEMKKLRMKSKKEGPKERNKTMFDSFAVVKSSFNPQQDFRDSMVEMIRAKGIAKAEELEELLACYLTLNCDSYHDLIIKVFRQVWSELNAASIRPRIHNSRHLVY